MFKVPADNLADYLDFDSAREAGIRKLHAAIREAAPGLKRYIHAWTTAGTPGMRFKMIGYGKFHYAASSGEKVAGL